MRNAFSAILLLMLFSSHAAACGPPELASNTQIPKTFVFETGWDISGLHGASVIRRYRDGTGSDVTMYKPSQDASVDLQGFELSEDGKSLRFVPGYSQWVETIWEYRVHGKIYAYDVSTVSTRKADPPMWRKIRARTGDKRVVGGVHKGAIEGVLGCGWTNLRYFDADGDGTFESLEYVGFGGPHSNATQCPTFPQWVSNMLPNREAAELCKNKEEGKMKIKMKLPPLLDKLVNQQPVMPILISERKK